MKKSLTLILSIAVLLILIIALKFLPNDQKADTLDTTTEVSASDEVTLEVVKVELKDLTSIVINQAEHTLTYLPPTTDDGHWSIENAEDYTLDQSALDYRIGEILDITSTRALDATTLSEYGLDQPTKTVVYNLKDGTSKKLLIGSPTTDKSCVYAMLEGDSKIYLLQQMIDNCLVSSIDTFRTTTLTDFNSESSVKKITISGSQFTPLTVTESSEQNGVVMSYELTTDNLNAVAASNDGVNQLVASLPSIDGTNLLETGVTNLSSYGLDQPVLHLVIDYYDPNSGTLDEKTNTTIYDTKQIDYIWGKTLEDGQIAFMQSGDNKVYAMDASFLTTLKEAATPFSLCSKFIALPNIDSVKTVDINFSDSNTTYHMDVDHANKAYKFNNKEMAEAEFKSLYQAVISLHADIALDTASANADPLVTITYILNDGSKQEVLLTASTINQYYQSYLNGSILVGCSKKQVTDLKATLDKAAQQ